MMSDGLPHEEGEMLAALQQNIGLAGARVLQVGILGWLEDFLRQDLQSLHWIMYFHVLI